MFKRGILSAAFCFLYLVSSAQAPDNKLVISHLTGDFYIFTTFKDLGGTVCPANGMYLVTEGGVVLFDTPWDLMQYQPLLDSIFSRHRKKVVLCIVTHSHEDRTGGLEYYRKMGIKTYSSRLTDSISQQSHENRAEFTFVNDTAFNVSKVRFHIHYPGIKRKRAT